MWIRADESQTGEARWLLELPVQAMGARQGYNIRQILIGRSEHATCIGGKPSDQLGCAAAELRGVYKTKTSSYYSLQDFKMANDAWGGFKARRTKGL